MNELSFYWRMGNYALKAVPWRLVRFDPDEPNETIDFVKFYPYDGKECCYSIGYFWYDENESCWEFKFVGGRFTEIEKEDIVSVFEMLKVAYKTLTEWKKTQTEIMERGVYADG